MEAGTCGSGGTVPGVVGCWRLEEVVLRGQRLEGVPVALRWQRLEDTPTPEGTEVRGTRGGTEVAELEGISTPEVTKAGGGTCSGTEWHLVVSLSLATSV